MDMSNVVFLSLVGGGPGVNVQYGMDYYDLASYYWCPYNCPTSVNEWCRHVDDYGTSGRSTPAGFLG